MFLPFVDEMTTAREIPLNDNSLAAFVTNVLPESTEINSTQENLLEVKTSTNDENVKSQDSPKINVSAKISKN